MDDLAKTLEMLCEGLEKRTKEFELINELSKKYRDPQVIAQKLVQKQIEDGIIAKLCNASVFQLKKLKGSNFFRYYDQDDMNKLIDIALTKRIRKDKLDRIKESI